MRDARGQGGGEGRVKGGDSIKSAEGREPRYLHAQLHVGNLECSTLKILAEVRQKTFWLETCGFQFYYA